MKEIKITDNRDEMAFIGHEIMLDKPEVYTPLMLSKLRERIAKDRAVIDEMNIDPEQILLCSIYDYWVYGNNIDEEFYYRFYEKSHEQKATYMTNRIRLVYMDYLCCGGVPADPAVRKERIDLLEKKFRCYKRLEPYYKRDIIEIKDEADYEIFYAFAKRHSTFVVKPSNFYYGLGVHKVNASDYKTIREAFDAILEEGVHVKKMHPSLESSIVVEELIEQVDELSVLHPSSINGIRATAVVDKDGKVIILHPWIKIGAGGQFVASAACDGFDAEIDPETGIIISDGYSENGSVFELHPDSNIRIKGYQIPQWAELKSFVEKLMRELPEYRYIGWDLVLTKNGWVVMEANYSGEFMWQLIRHCGGKEEFEKIIGWSMDADYWWKIRPYVAH